MTAVLEGTGLVPATVSAAGAVLTTMQCMCRQWRRPAAARMTRAAAADEHAAAASAAPLAVRADMAVPLKERAAW